jgi:hypothetical protein
MKTTYITLAFCARPSDGREPGDDLAGVTQGARRQIREWYDALVSSGRTGPGARAPTSQSVSMSADMPGYVPVIVCHSGGRPVTVYGDAIAQGVVKMTLERLIDEERSAYRALVSAAGVDRARSYIDHGNV